MDYFLFDFSGVQFHYTMSRLFKSQSLAMSFAEECACVDWAFEGNECWRLAFLFNLIKGCVLWII